MTIAAFQKMILAWHAIHGRHELPWRKTHDPYLVLVSEVMLQQTQVDRVLPKFLAFTERFPTTCVLARASVSDVLDYWHGLGYNRRALYLHRAAQTIEAEFKGDFPRAVPDIQSLPGVGPYTARAVAAFSFNAPEVFIETNIRRIFIHHFFPEHSEVSDAELFPLIEKALYRKDPHRWYSALMDYGAGALKKIPNPNKRSAHYVKQSKFEGSRRYARAKVVEYLLKKRTTVSADVIRTYFETDPYLECYREIDVLTSILSDLVEEGFLSQKKKLFSIRAK